MAQSVDAYVIAFQYFWPGSVLYHEYTHIVELQLMYTETRDKYE